MKTNISIRRIWKVTLGVTLAIAAVGCTDYLNKEPLSDYLSSNFYNNEEAIKQGTTGCYQQIFETNEETENIPFSINFDHYTPFGIQRADNKSIGVGSENLTTNYTIENIWLYLYGAVARCNSVLDGAAPFYDGLSDQSKIYLAEVKTLRAYFYIRLVSLFGDVPFFVKGVTEDELHNVDRTHWNTITDQLIADLDETAAILPWQQNDWGRIDKSVALGLKSRIALYAGSWDKFGFGQKGTKNEERAANYFRLSADAALRIIEESGRGLSPDFAGLFTRVGQMQSDAKREIMLAIMYSDQASTRSHYISFTEQARSVKGQSGRFPTQQIVDTYECTNGKRIDEKGSGYNPQTPFENRDPRLKMSIYTHHDTMIGNNGSKAKVLMELYNPKTYSFDENNEKTLIDNLDYVGAVAQYGYIQSGVGYVWKKYNHFDDEITYLATYNFALMRYAEILLNYAEAKIELNEIDASVINSIDGVRQRVHMPSILSVDPSRAQNQLKMRQIVRRERKVEFARENLFFFDMRRWRTGKLQNAEPTYGYPIATGVDSKNNIYPDGYTQVTPDMVPSFGATGSERDLNDIPCYETFASKLRKRDMNRSWNDMFYIWPIPQTERNKAPWLTQNDGYGQ